MATYNHVTSTVGKGSAFCVSIPAQVSEPIDLRAFKGARIGVRLEDGLHRVALEQAITDCGGLITATTPDFWITTSSTFEAASEPTVLLSDIGDTSSDRLLDQELAADALAMPYSRQQLWDLLERATKREFRGRAIKGSEASEPRLQRFEGLRVLAADDNAVNREVLREALKTLNVDVVLVENGEEALKAFQSSQFNLVFMKPATPMMNSSAMMLWARKPAYLNALSFVIAPLACKLVSVSNQEILMAKPHPSVPRGKMIVRV